jgi:hypothetical protein
MLDPRTADSGSPSDLALGDARGAGGGEEPLDRVQDLPLRGAELAPPIAQPLKLLDDALRIVGHAGNGGKLFAG